MVDNHLRLESPFSPWEMYRPGTSFTPVRGHGLHLRLAGCSNKKERVMPWKEVSIMSAREEFVVLASQEGANVRELCRRFKISAPTGYKWLTRYRAGGI